MESGRGSKPMTDERGQEVAWPHWPGRARDGAGRARLERHLFRPLDPAQPYLVLAPGPSGYLLHERQGEVPPVGARLTLDDRAYQVTRVGRSPLPGDERACVFAERDGRA